MSNFEYLDQSITKKEGWRIANLEEVRENYDTIKDLIPEWHIVAFKGGKIFGYGSGYNNKIEEGSFFGSCGQNLWINKSEEKKEIKEYNDDDFQFAGEVVSEFINIGKIARAMVLQGMKEYVKSTFGEEAVAKFEN